MATFIGFGMLQPDGLYLSESLIEISGFNDDRIFPDQKIGIGIVVACRFEFDKTQEIRRGLLL